jgi:hypothetical protein
MHRLKVIPMHCDHKARWRQVCHHIQFGESDVRPVKVSDDIKGEKERQDSARNLLQSRSRITAVVSALNKSGSNSFPGNRGRSCVTFILAVVKVVLAEQTIDFAR